LRRWGWLAWATLIVAVSVVPADWLLGAAPRQAWSALASAAHFLELLVLTGLLLWRDNDRGAVDSIGRAAAAQRDPAAAARTRTVGPIEKCAPRPAANLVSAVLTAAMVAVAVELVQWPLPYRSLDPLDLAADGGGIAVATAAFLIGRRRSPQ
jgi:hypothetical protein